GGSGAGVGAVNKISIQVQAAVNGVAADGVNHVHATNVTLTAVDSSSIQVTAAGASLAGAFAGQNAGALSIAASIARNPISNDVEASIGNAVVTAPSGNVVLTAHETSGINALSVAASLAVAAGGSGIGAALSGAGAEGTNVILTKTNAFLLDSTIGDATTAG